LAFSPTNKSILWPYYKKQSPRKDVISCTFSAGCGDSAMKNFMQHVKKGPIRNMRDTFRCRCAFFGDNGPLPSACATGAAIIRPFCWQSRMGRTGFHAAHAAGSAKQKTGT
jgi:hypothetical protein